MHFKKDETRTIVVNVSQFGKDDETTKDAMDDDDDKEFEMDMSEFERLRSIVSSDIQTPKKLNGKDNGNISSFWNLRKGLKSNGQNGSLNGDNGMFSGMNGWH